MGKGAIALGGLLTLVSTYVLTFYANGPLYAWGYPALFLLPDIFTNPGNYVLASPPLVGYAVGILLALFLLAGIFQLLGTANGKIGIFGGVVGLLGCLYMVMVFMTGTSIIPFQFAVYVELFAGSALVPGTIPYHLGVAATAYPGTLGLGLITAILGGILSLIGQTGRD